MSPSRVRRSGVPFDLLCASCGLPAPLPEVTFATPPSQPGIKKRRWRWDWAWPKQKVALEKNGGVWIRGRHSRGQGQIDDFEKWSEGAALGWRVIHVVPNDLESTVTFDLIRRALGVRVP